MKFENKGKWIKQINEAKGATLNGTDDIELEFDTRRSKVYITINGDLTYVVDEDKFNDNVSDFIYDEVNKDKTKFNLNWFKHFGKLNRYLRKVESAQKNEDDAKSVVARMTKDQAKKLYDKLNKWGLNSFDIKDRIALLKEIDNRFHFSKTEE